jgi:peptidoglycan/LPS O-acetylase OafA/YrhL
LPNGAGLWFVFPLNLFFGVVLALIAPRQRYGFPFVAIGCIAAIIANGYMGWFNAFGPSSALLCTGAVWSLAVLPVGLPTVLEPFRWMGKLSYGMYLLHSFGLSAAARIIAHLPANIYMVITLTTAFAVLLAWAMQICVETPFLALRRSLSRNTKLRYTLAGIQVGLIPGGVFLAVIQTIIR